MSFSHTNAPGAFIDLMNRVFRNYLDLFVIVFINGIFVYSKNESDQMGYLRVVFLSLIEHQLHAKYSKCEFWLRSVNLYRHIICSEGVEVDPWKTEAVKNWPRPSNPRH